MKRRGQISIEIMYSVSVILVIFLILTSFTFDKKVEVEKMRETIEKRSDCVMISNSLGRAAALGEGHSSTFKTSYNFDIFDSGLIVIGDIAGSTPTEVEVVCSYNGILGEEAYTDKYGAWKVFNNGENLTLEGV